MTQYHVHVISQNVPHLLDDTLRTIKCFQSVFAICFLRFSALKNQNKTCFARYFPIRIENIPCERKVADITFIQSIGYEFLRFDESFICFQVHLAFEWLWFVLCVLCFVGLCCLVLSFHVLLGGFLLSTTVLVFELHAYNVMLMRHLSS